MIHTAGGCRLPLCFDQSLPAMGLASLHRKPYYRIWINIQQRRGHRGRAWALRKPAQSAGDGEEAQERLAVDVEDGKQQEAVLGYVLMEEGGRMRAGCIHMGCMSPSTKIGRSSALTRWSWGHRFFWQGRGITEGDPQRVTREEYVFSGTSKCH
jgi:hypothetical protein